MPCNQNAKTTTKIRKTAYRGRLYMPWQNKNFPEKFVANPKYKFIKISTAIG
jgi:hypothetical protein